MASRQVTSWQVDIPTPDGTADAFVAAPEGDGPHPAVLFYMDIFGLRPVLNGMAEQLASYGYYVLAPNVFYRHGRAPVAPVPDMSEPEQREAFFQQVRPMLMGHTPDRSVPDAGAFLEFLEQQDEVAPGPVGATGYCLGGLLSVRTAAAYPEQVAAAASFHGGHLATDAEDSPHRLAEHISAELHFGHAEHDDAMTPEDVDRLEKALDAAGVRYTSEVYPGTVHGFTMADTSAFNESALERHWERLPALLARNLPTS